MRAEGIKMELYNSILLILTLVVGWPKPITLFRQN